MNKRYMVFTYEGYYPSGGSGDAIDIIFTSKKAIINYLNEPRDFLFSFEYIEVLDLDTAQWNPFNLIFDSQTRKVKESF